MFSAPASDRNLPDCLPRPPITAHPDKALVRDLNHRINLGALTYKKLADPGEYLMLINLNWPAVITDTEFFRLTRDRPTAKIHRFLSS